MTWRVAVCAFAGYTALAALVTFPLVIRLGGMTIAAALERPTESPDSAASVGVTPGHPWVMTRLVVNGPGGG